MRLLLDEFLEQCGGPGRRLGVPPLQLPPSLALDARSAVQLPSRLRAGWDGDVACEPRHASRFTARAAMLRADAARPRRTWVVFDNTAHGHALANALRLQALLRD